MTGCIMSWRGMGEPRGQRVQMGGQERGRETGKGAGQGGARVAVTGQQYQNSTLTNSRLTEP
jgi:hypothetical protein